METISNLKYRFSTAGMAMKLIYINIAIFLVLRIIGIFCFFFGTDVMSILRYIELPSSFEVLAKMPWTLITYMFAHYDVMHILFNMLVLYWFGNIFQEFFTPKQLCGLYIIGGIGGGLLYMAAYAIMPGLEHSFGWLIGASASIMAIVLATAVRVPQYTINLFLFGAVSLKWIAIIYVFIDFLSISGENMGGHIAHLGGALIGVLFAIIMKRGCDITSPINKFIDFCLSIGKPKNLFKKKKNSTNHTTTDYKHTTKSTDNSTCTSSMSKEDEQTLDAILDKIKKSGYSALSEEEKRRLFQVSNKR